MKMMAMVMTMMCHCFPCCAHHHLMIVLVFIYYYHHIFVPVLSDCHHRMLLLQMIVDGISNFMFSCLVAIIIDYALIHLVLHLFSVLFYTVVCQYVKHSLYLLLD